MNSQAEAWMTEIQDKFNDATNRKLKYVEQVTLKEKRTREDAERREYVDKARARRNTAHAVFEALSTYSQRSAFRRFRSFVQKYFARAEIEENSQFCIERFTNANRKRISRMQTKNCYSYYPENQQKLK